VVHGGPGGPGGPGRPDGSRRRFRRAAGPLTGYCAAAAGTAVAVAAGGTRHPVAAIAVVALVLLAAATRMTLPAALISGAIGWFFYDGFVIGRHASLGWDGVREVWWLLILMAAAGCGYALGRVFAHAGTGRDKCG
jgi:hypothetical protein